KEIDNIVKKGVEVFSQLGAKVEVVDIGIPYSHQKLSDTWHNLMMNNAIATIENFKQEAIDLLKDYYQDFPQELLNWFESGYKLSLLDHIQDQQVRTNIYDLIQSVFKDFDLIITPTLACSPVDNETNGNTKGPTHINGIEVDPLIGWCLTYITNFTGHPSASIPVGLTKRNLPVGMQIIGNHFRDTDVLLASAAFEKANPWDYIYKVCATRDI